MKKIRALIVDDHYIVQEDLIHIIQKEEEIECIGTANDGQEAIEKVEQDILLFFWKFNNLIANLLSLHGLHKNGRYRWLPHPNN